MTDLYRQYHDRLRDEARMLCRCHHLADDLMQDVWIKVSRASYDGRAALPWLRTILRNAYRDHLRYEARRPHMSLEYDPSVRESPTDRICKREQLARLLDKLPEHLAQVVRLRLQGLSTREISKRFGIPEGTVRSRLHTAHKKSRAA